MLAGVTYANWARLFTLGLIWGASFMFVSIAVQDYPPLTTAALRIALGAVALMIVLRLANRRLPDFRSKDGRTIWMFAAVMGVFSNALPFSLLSWGQTYVASGFAGVSMATVPLIVLPLAHVLIPGERMTLMKSIGFGLGFVGVILLIGLRAFESSGQSMETLARLASVGAAGCYAMGAIVTRLCPKVDLLSLAASTMLCATAMMVPIALWQDGWPAGGSALGISAIIYLGLLPTGLAQIFLVQVIREAGPSFLTLVNYQVPIWSVIFGLLFLGEALPENTITALTLILVGMAISQRFGNRPARPGIKPQI